MVAAGEGVQPEEHILYYADVSAPENLFAFGGCIRPIGFIRRCQIECLALTKRLGLKEDFKTVSNQGR